MVFPSAARRAELDTALGNLTEAIEAHDLWTPPRPNSSLYWVWDFVKRSRYMLSEVENVQHGRALKHPDQIRPPPGTGDQAAIGLFNDVCGRSFMTQLLITDTSGKTALMTGQSAAPIDFGSRCKEKALELVNVSDEAN